jgi:superfamily II DNA or RNA helicase
MDDQFDLIPSQHQPISEASRSFSVARSTLRPYQIAAIDRLRQAFAAGHKRVVLQLCTGAGKTVVAAEMIRNSVAKGKRCLFICDRIELIEQTSRRFDAEGIPHGVIQGQHERWQPHQPVQVCSIQTLARRRRFPEVHFMVWDECHSQYSAGNKIMETWNNVPMVGLSATPWSKGLGKHWQHLIVGATTSDLIEQGYLVPFTVYGPPGPDLSNVHTVAGEYHQGELGQAADKPRLIADIVRTWLMRGEDRQTICFATNIAHSKHIVAEFVGHGIRAEHIDAYSDTDDRRATLDRFRRGETRIVSSVDILSKGFDEPSASCMIAARPTKSLILHVQQVGRCLRPAPGKQSAIILDHAGNTERLGFVSDPLPDTLDDGKHKESSQRKVEDRPEPLPKTCPKCHFMRPAKVHVCPACGHKPERQNKVVVEAGELVKFAKADTATKKQWYAMLLYNARKHGWRDGAADHAYRAKFGVWPSDKRVQPIPPSEEVLKWVQHLAMKRAKSAPKPLPQNCRYCGSANIIRSAGKGPHEAGIECAGCGRHLAWVPKP